MVQILFIYRTFLTHTLLLSCIQCVGQSTNISGFYIVVNTDNCPNLIPLLSGSGKSCVAKKPIISIAEFESLSEIQADQLTNQKTMTLKLSPKGAQTWDRILKSLPDSKLVLVIDGYSVGTFKNEGHYVYSYIPIRAPIGAKELEWIYEHLQEELK